MKTLKIVTTLLLTFSFSFPTYAADGQIQQKEQLLAYLNNEEQMLQRDTNVYMSLSESIKNAQINGAYYEVTWQAGLLGGLGSAVGGIVHTVARVSFQNTKPSKALIVVSGVTFAFSFVTWTTGLYKSSLTTEEITDLQRRIDTVTANLNSRRAGILALKKQIGIDTQNIQIQGSPTGALVLPNGR